MDFLENGEILQDIREIFNNDSGYIVDKLQLPDTDIANGQRRRNSNC